MSRDRPDRMIFLRFYQTVPSDNNGLRLDARSLTGSARFLLLRRQQAHERQIDSGLIHRARPVSFPLVADICFRRLHIFIA